MAGCLARQVKEAFPTLPLVFHTHYQTGYGYMSYMEAVKNGANGVECSLGFPDGAGQPYGLTMLRVFEELGFNTGDPDKAAMNKLSEFCKVMRPSYKQANVMRTPDISVESSGIAGGQRSILDKELVDAGQPHLIPLVDIEVAKVRAEGGKVGGVLPTWLPLVRRICMHLAWSRRMHRIPVLFCF
jgi:pyruvate/oxaloacetate carboxyltransferase